MFSVLAGPLHLPFNISQVVDFEYFFGGKTVQGVGHRIPIVVCVRSLETEPLHTLGLAQLYILRLVGVAVLLFCLFRVLRRRLAIKAFHSLAQFVAELLHLNHSVVLNTFFVGLNTLGLLPFGVLSEFLLLFKFLVDFAHAFLFVFGFLLNVLELALLDFDVRFSARLDFGGPLSPHLRVVVTIHVFIFVRPATVDVFILG